MIKHAKVKIKMMILPLDAYHETDGTQNMNKTGMMTPNDWVYKAAQERPDVFEAAISVHPYRKDALEQLELWAKKGAKLVKRKTIKIIIGQFICIIDSSSKFPKRGSDGPFM